MLRRVNIFRVIGMFFAVVVFVYATYYLKHPDKNGLRFLPLFMGLMLLFISLSEFKEKRKLIGLFLLSISIYLLYVSLK
jgi:hypothetical protein